MKIKKTDSKGYFPETWYTAKIVNIEPYKTIYGHKLLFWFEVKNEHARTMTVTDFFPREFTEDNRTGKIVKLIMGEAKEFVTSDLIGQRVMVNLKKKISRKRKRSYLNVVAYKKVEGVARENVAGLEGTDTVATPSPDQVAKLLKSDKRFAMQVNKFLKQPDKKPEKAKHIGDILKEGGGES